MGFASEEARWLKKFHDVWKRATSGNSRTAVYDLTDGPETYTIPKIDWDKK